jgi:purine-nucleoside phosphorylase
MRIKNRIVGRLARAVGEGLTRPQKIARAELGCTAVAPVVLLPVTRPMTSRLVKSLRRARREGDAWHGTIGGRDVSVVNTGVGAPSAEGKVVACLGVGARVLVRADVCGALRDDMRVGDVVVAERAAAFDNATRLAGGPEEVAASPALLRVAADVLGDARRWPRYFNAVVATVDTFHHQTAAMLREWSAKAAAVDMETSIIYHLAGKAGAHALSVMAVSDVPVGGGDPFGEGPFDYGDLYQAFDDLTALAVEIVKKLPAAGAGFD